MFTNFKNLQNLYLQNTRTNRIEAEAFSVINNLNKLYLTNNYLEKISSNIFPVYNALHTLDLSHNLLNDLSEFDISMFPSIVFLNISHNRLEYLPENIMNKLKEENKFYLIADNNPWNCEHPGWVQHLTTIFIDAFCTNNNYDSRKVEEKMEKLSTGYLVYKDDTGIWSVCSAKCAFNHCLIWMFGAVWFGIILGNTCKIKRLLFTEPTRYEDKAIQCGKYKNISLT
ncbi:hypothetical protein NQ314_008983 [Rhamnusium bicolor]|uniref:Uncharacterized protein n=1 Tax=Rhamnusium bicolor TaxID=1586634 RepID=A0AAV8Y6L9_9CUCU|nr:hypothetical protein NQ314_008983 [Rhamnusium bicolor]